MKPELCLPITNPFRRNCKSGRFHWERLWQLPLWDVYKQDIESDIADVKNYSGKQSCYKCGEILEYFMKNTLLGHILMSQVWL
jgi:leucyl aminopeptidase